MTREEFVNLSYRQAARLLDISENAVWKYDHRGSKPSLGTLIKIALKTKLSIEEIISALEERQALKSKGSE